MKSEELEGLGLEKDVIAQVMKLNEEDIEREKKSASTTLENELGVYKEKLETATKALEEFKTDNPKELKETIEQLQKDLLAKDEEYSNKESERNFLGLVKEAIHSNGGRNEKAIMALLDLESLKNSKNQTDDIKQALDSTKESDAYLFGAKEPINNPVGSVGGNKETDSTTAMMRSIMGLPVDKTDN